MNDASQTIRTFIAISINEKVTSHFGSALLPLKKQYAQTKLRWMPLENMHITLRFLGAIPVNQVTEISERLNRICRAVPAFDIDFSGLCYFPNEAHARIAAIDVSLNETLKTLAENIDQAMIELGFRPEKKSFHPHVTIARIKHGHNLSFDFKMPPISMRVNQIKLMQTIQEDSGVRYKALRDITLTLS